MRYNNKLFYIVFTYIFSIFKIIRNIYDCCYINPSLHTDSFAQFILQFLKSQ